MSNPIAANSAWSSYWRSGALHSLGPAGEGLPPALSQEWVAWFNELPSGGTVIDLASGNGALARMALGLDGASDDPARHVHAVDLAELSPRWLADLDEARARRLTWHERTPLERLPIADASVDALVSQFGFEYAERGLAAVEATRVTTARARARFLVHHAGSLILRRGRAEAIALQELLAPEGLFSRAEEVALVLQARTRGERRDPREAERVRNAYNALQQVLGARIERDPDGAPVIEDARRRLHGVLARIAAGEASQRDMAAVRHAFASTAARLGDLMRVALDDVGIQDLRLELEARGWRRVELDVERQHPEGEPIGWRINAERGG